MHGVNIKNKKKIIRTNFEFKAVPCFRPLVAGLSPRRSGFVPMSVRVRFMVDDVAMEQWFSSSPSVFPCHYHFTNAPYYFSSIFYS